jgi:hypothetical protein
MTATSLSDGRSGVDEAALIRKIVGGQQDLFSDLIAPHPTALSCMVPATIGGYTEVGNIVQQTAFKAFIRYGQRTRSV